MSTVQHTKTKCHCPFGLRGDLKGFYHILDWRPFWSCDMLCFCVRLFIVALWSPAVKGLASWLSFVMSNCEFVTFPLVPLVRCGTWLYQFLIFASFYLNFIPYLDCLIKLFVCLRSGSLRPINNLSVTQGRVFLGWTSTKLGLMCLAQGPQHSDADEARTHSFSVYSQAPYHWATALPVLSNEYFIWNSIWIYSAVSEKNTINHSIKNIWNYLLLLDILHI